MFHHRVGLVDRVLVDDVSMEIGNDDSDDSLALCSGIIDLV